MNTQTPKKERSRALQMKIDETRKLAQLYNKALEQGTMKEFVVPIEVLTAKKTVLAEHN